MKRFFALAALVLTIVASGAAPAGAGPAGALSGNTATSRTWSGYIARGSSFDTVSAAWIEPAVTCPVANARASFWVGFDGWGNGTVEQVGTIGQCDAAGHVRYRAWWEMVASTGDRGGEDFAVAPGDRMAGSVRFASGAFRLEMRDLTNGGRFVKLERCTVVCERKTAEWIVERPGSGNYALADYRTAAFSRATCSAHEHPGRRPPHPLALLRVTMQQAGTVLSQPEPPTGEHAPFDGRFSWRAAR